MSHPRPRTACPIPLIAVDGGLQRKELAEESAATVAPVDFAVCLVDVAAQYDAERAWLRGGA